MKNQFNQTANKVVKYSDCMKELKQRYKTELTFGEKIFKATLDPLCTVIAAIAHLRDRATGKLAEKFPNSAVQQWKVDGQTFVNRDWMIVGRYYDVKNSFNKKATEKMWDMAEEIFEKAPDCRTDLRLTSDKAIFKN